MRIGMFIWSYWPEPEGGAERQCRMLTEGLTRAGHSCVVLAAHAPGCPDKDCDPQGIRVERLGRLAFLENRIRRCLFDAAVRTHPIVQPAARVLAFWSLVPFLWLARISFWMAVRRYVKLHPVAPFDVLHVHDSGWLAGLAVWMSRIWNIPVVCKESTAPPLQPVSYGTPRRRYWMKLRLGADGWQAQTEAASKGLKALGIPSAKISLIPNGVRIPACPADADVSSTVLYVGNLTQGVFWKGFDVLFEAWSKVVARQPSARLCFVGHGDQTPWRRMLERSGLAHTVHFAGRVDDPSSFYQRAAILVLPSRVEGLSNALLEAQSWGLACVVSDIPGNLAVVKPEENGLVVPVGDPASLAEALLRLLEDPALRRRLGAGARACVIRNSSLEHMVENMLVCYQRAGGQFVSETA